jgi:hypothetical protein
MAIKSFSEVDKFAEESLGLGSAEDWRKKPRTVATPEEQAERASTGRTQGKKGCKAPRINVTLTTENYEFLKNCSGLLFGSKTMSHLVNILIEKYRTEKADAFQQATEMRNRLQE